MKKLLLILSLLTSPVFAKTWIHFKGDVGYYDAYYTVKALGFTPQEQLDRPYRFSIAETPSPLQKKEALKDKRVLGINESSEKLFEQKYFSKWGVEEKKSKAWTKYAGYGALAFVTYQGIAMWDWFEDVNSIDDSFKMGFGDEHWFSQASYSGGADKTGHMMSYYFQKRALNWMFINLGNSLDDSNLYSTGVAAGLGLLVEVGDGFSSYQFSYEDVVMDLVGVTFAYFADKYPWFDELIGLRWEYWPSSDQKKFEQHPLHNPTSDYSGQSYWISLKGAGIPRVNETWARYATIDLGFYSRGFKPHNRPGTKWPSKYRTVALGVGLNLSELIFKAAPNNKFARDLSRFNKYWVAPGTIYQVARGKMDEDPGLDVDFF